MGLITLQCVVANGTRLLGLSYEAHYGDQTVNANNVLLVQSNPDLKDVRTIQWSLVSSWPRTTGYPQDASPMVCQVDPKTGVFSMMSYFNLTDSTYNMTQPPKRPPGGLQYDPRSDTWSNFTLAPGYKWGDYSATFALFQWPGTSTLFQANIGSATKVNVGMLDVDEDDSGKFENVFSYELNPAIYGYPSRLFFGNNVLYQFGTIVVNNRTGQLNNLMTRIPLSGNPATFKPPTNPILYNATSLNACATTYITGSYYKDTLYIFCQGVDSDLFLGVGGVILFKDSDNKTDSGLSAFYDSDIDRFYGSTIQPIGGADDGDLPRFAYMTNAPTGIPQIGIWLDPKEIGDVVSAGYDVNITNPYGDEFASDKSSRTHAIVGGSVGGGMVLLLLLAFFLIRRRWPQWRRQLKAKIVERLSPHDSSDDHNNEGKDTDPINGGQSDKIEEPSIHSCDMDGRDKILVTEEMEMDLARGYMKDVALERHPRPTFVTTLNTDEEEEVLDDTAVRIRHSMAMVPLQTSASSRTELSDPAIGPRPASSGSSSSTALASMPHPLATTITIHNPSAPHLYTHADGTKTSQSQLSTLMPSAHIDSTKAQEAEDIKATARESALYEEAAPPYIGHYQEQQEMNLSSLTRPSFPLPPTPTAPSFITEEEARISRLSSPRAIIVDETGITGPNLPHAFNERSRSPSNARPSPGSRLHSKRDIGASLKATEEDADNKIPER
ncbi:hypothetical protein EDD11_009406 [Mortierella claussenii]|nr:hypothetical protein EDD11_009406 [Mortierella claussenii]